MADKIIRIKRENREQAIGVTRERGEQDVLLAPERVVIRSVTSYEQLDDLPQINDVTLIGNKSFEDLGAESLTNLEIEAIINSVAYGGDNGNKEIPR